MKDQSDQIIKKLEKIEKEIELIRKNFESFVISVGDSKQPIKYEHRDYEKILKQIIESLNHLKYITASYIQRKYAVGYARAAKFLDRLEEKGLIAPADGNKPRKVLKKR